MWIAIVFPLVFRKAQRGRDTKASEKEPTSPPPVGRDIRHDCKQDDFSFGPMKSQEILKRANLWFSTNLEMIQK
jgi:hypothetical protein